jgi:hypothetical protein
MSIRERVNAVAHEVEAGRFVEAIDGSNARIVHEQYFVFPPGSTPMPDTKKTG